MRTVDVLIVLTAVLMCTSVHGNDANFLLNSNSFPERTSVPTLSNGNLGFVVNSDSVYLTGVYNGYRSQSRRARIPNYANLHLTQCANPENNPPYCSYQLDMKFGRFRTVYNDPSRSYRLVHDVYPHRYFAHVIVNRFRIQRLSAVGNIQATIQSNPGNPSADIAFGASEKVAIRNETYNFQCGRTKEVEDPDLQQSGTNVCVYYPDYPKTIQLTGDDRTAQDFFFYTVFARSTEVAEQELQRLTIINQDAFHTSRMNEAWASYGISVSGNNELDRVIKASAFQLFSNVPSTFTEQHVVSFGISPSGIGRGGTVGEDFQGHNLWDMDLWMFPVILLLDPTNARELLRYRGMLTQNALAGTAAKNGFEGWQYPWKSAFTGHEVSSSAKAPEFNHHVTADVAFAARQYLLATDDLLWMEHEGCKLAYETAQFWQNRSVYNPVTDKFDILSVTGPDDTNSNVDNSVFTNVVAAYNLLFGEFAGCMCRISLGLRNNQWEGLARVAKSLLLLRNETEDFHPQFDGYEIGTKIGQADVVLLGYPLELSMNISTKRRNLDIYGDAVLSNSSAMTWPMHTIGWLDLDELDRADLDFTKSYQPYVRPPFSVWNERPTGFPGASNFVTGAAGFLQAIINGYAGVRLRNDRLVIDKPRLPPSTTHLHIPQLNYMDMKFSLDVYSTLFSITIKSTSGRNLKLFVDDQAHEICQSCVINGTRNARFEHTRSVPIRNGCKMQPLTMNMRLADQNGGMVNKQTPLLLVALLAGWILRKFI